MDQKMSNTIRIDKYLADMSMGTRSQIKLEIKKGKIKINHEVCRDPKTKVIIGEDIVQYNDLLIQYKLYEYYMLNKPQGVVSATEDKQCKTVLDLIISKNRKDLFPVGRLDKDTEGLLIITNDGQLAYKLLAPHKHVSKIYYAKIHGVVTEDDIQIFSQGIKINEDFQAMPAQLKVIKSDLISEIELTIFEGKFHQVKRMFEAVNKEVIYLKRIAMGSLTLDHGLEVGQYRELTTREVEGLIQ